MAGKDGRLATAVTILVDLVVGVRLGVVGNGNHRSQVVVVVCFDMRKLESLIVS